MNPKRNLKRGRNENPPQRKMKKGLSGLPVRVKDPNEGLDIDDEEDDLDFDDPFLDEIIDNSNHPQQTANNGNNIQHPPNVSHTTDLFNPTSDKLKSGEELVFHNNAYTLFHRFTSNWPVLSFDLISRPQFLGSSHFPYEVFVVSGTQVKDSGGRPGMNPLTRKPERCHFDTWKLGNMHRTTNDSDDEDDPTLEDDEHFMEEPTFLREATNVPGTIGDQNRIRVMPQKPSVCCIYGDGGRFGIYDQTGLLSKITDCGNLKYMHSRSKVIHMSKDKISDGFGLDWSRVSSGLFALGGNDRLLRIYRMVESGQVSNISKLGGHGGGIEDIQFSPSEGNVLASTGCDGNIIIWDLRQKKPGMKVREVSSTDVNVISWNKTDNFYISSGDDDGYLKVWDLRQLYQPSSNSSGGGKKGKKGIWIVDKAVPAAEYRFHKKAITSVEWNPFHTSMLLSTSEEDICVVWDLSAESGDEVPVVGNANGTAIRPPPRDLRGIPEQVLFIHQGQEMMKEAHWHPQYENLIVSCGNRTIHVFQPLNIKPSKVNIPPKPSISENPIEEEEEEEELGELDLDGEDVLKNL